MAISKTSDGFRNSIISEISSPIIHVPVVGVDNTFSSSESQRYNEKINVRSIRLQSLIDTMLLESTSGQYPLQIDKAIQNSIVVINNVLRLVVPSNIETIVSFDGIVKTIEFFHLIKYVVPSIGNLFRTVPAGVPDLVLGLKSRIVVVCD